MLNRKINQFGAMMLENNKYVLSEVIDTESIGIGENAIASENDFLNC